MQDDKQVIRWLHLSDFHFQPTEGWDRRRTTAALLEYLGDRKKKGWRPDLVFASGDFANHGKEKEFDQAILFFKKLAEILELDLANDLFVVPGNHDVDRGAIKPAHKAVLTDLFGLNGTDQQERIAETLRDPDVMRLLGKRLAAYYEFTERLLGPARRTTMDRPWRVDVRVISGIEVAVMQLNSAWASGTDDKGNLLVGAHQLDEALAEASSARVRFALFHHPPDYLADGDASHFRGGLQAAGGAHFLLRGHLHENDLERSIDPAGNTLRLAAGAVYQGTNWPKRFEIGEIDLARGKGSVELLTYSGREHGFWTVDATSYRQLKNGIYQFKLPGDLAKGRPHAKPDSKVKETRRQAAFLRYRQAVAAVHGQMRFIGFPATATGTRPNVGVAELFVPLRLARAKQAVGEDSATSLSTAELLRRLAEFEEKPGRFVVLGEPGSGKTTLCRFAAAALAGQSEAAKALGRAATESLPLYLPFRDYLHRRKAGPDCGILDFLVEEAQNHLQVGSVDRAFFEEALMSGKAILLLDGLDEVGLPKERAGECDRVLAFCSQYPRLAVVVTSRFAGYEDVPLPEGLFQRLELECFDDNDLRIFVTNWYAVQEPKDSQARERGISDLVAALETEDRIRALAGNPLLATLIALVHRTEAKLPGERAKLYDLLVRTLIETWPQQAKRTFHEIDADLQRSYLEDFAFGRQERRSIKFSEVTFSRDELVNGLATIVWRREKSRAPEVTRRLVERWVDFLAAETGIIVEQGPGVYSFFHLSLLEYLAARALLRQQGAFEDAIARLVNETAWREVLLLAVGSRATDSLLLERVFSVLEAEKKWFFLLLCLREEAAFDNSKRQMILDRVSRLLLEQQKYEWKHCQNLIWTMERFSVRHGKAIRSWRVRNLESSLGAELQGVVAISLDMVDILDLVNIFNNRPDCQEVAVDLLDFWPGSQLGDWAARQATACSRLAVSLGPAELATFRSIVGLLEGGSLASATAPLNLKAAAHFVDLARGCTEKIARHQGAIGKNIPASLSIKPSGIDLWINPRWPSSRIGSNPVKIYYSSWDYSRDFSWEEARGFSRGLSIPFAAELMSEFAGYLARYTSRNFDSIIFDLFPSESLGFTSRNVLEMLSPIFYDHFARYLFDYFDTVGEWNAALGSMFCEFNSKDEELMRAKLSPKEKPAGGLISIPGNSALQGAAIAITARRVAEGWIALETTNQSSTEEAAAYFGHRLQNLSLHYLWAVFDEKLHEMSDPEHLALYLQLGWTQSTTTHEWPATERWIALMKAGPPQHWLPRAQWHLCWLLHDPTDANHQRPFNAALREGLADADPGRHAWAETLEQLIGFYPEENAGSAAG